MSEVDSQPRPLPEDRVIPRSEWEWFGYAGHFICASKCRFRLCTKVGDFLISTVGDMWFPDYSKGTGSKKRETFGAGENSFFETYVFRAGARCTVADCGCNQPTLAEACEIDGERCATAGEAQALHLKYCEKYAKPGAARDE